MEDDNEIADSNIAGGGIAVDMDLNIEDIMSDADFGEGNDVGMVNTQSANLTDNDDLESSAVSNSGVFAQHASAQGGHAYAEEGIDETSDGGDAGDGGYADGDIDKDVDADAGDDVDADADNTGSSMATGEGDGMGDADGGAGGTDTQEPSLTQLALEPTQATPWAV